MNNKITHELKLLNTYYERIISGIKKFEVRYNDRDYQVGDYIVFDVFSKDTPSFYIRQKETWQIVYVHSGLGMQDNYVILSIEQV